MSNGGFGLDEFDPEELDGGGDRPKPGKYLVMIQSAELTEKDYYKVGYEVVAGAVPGQEGKTNSESYFMSPKAKVRIALLFMACGLLTREMIAAMKARNEEWYPDWNALIGRRCVLELEKKDKYTNVTFRGMFHPDSPEAEGIPGCGADAVAGGNGAAGATPAAGGQFAQQAQNEFSGAFTV